MKPLLAWAALALAITGGDVADRPAAVDGPTAVRADATIDRPLACVWGVAHDAERFPEFIPRLSKSARIAAPAGEDRYFVVVNPPFPFKEIAHVLAVKFDAGAKRIEWRMVEGNILRNDGTVTIAEDRGRTRLEMRTMLDMGGAWPRFLVGWGVRYYLPKVVAGFRQRVLESCAGAAP